MKRWAVLVAALYLVILIALTVPVLLAAFGWMRPPQSPLGEVISVYAEAPYWIWVIVMVACQLALLSVPVRVASRRPVTRSALWPTILVAGLMMGILVTAAFVAIDEFVYRLEREAANDWIGWSGVAAGLATWGIWAYVFGRAAKVEAPRDLVARQCRLLFQGSILELLIAVPTHIVARSRDYCCAGFMTFVGLTMGISVMLFAFGPALYFLFAERWRQLHPQAG
ncbi:MAG: hypothetical protein OEW16_03460 [Gammaproteobacteria bacterium]|nr:hypothetical protein [Gammaproteobacteria bacterium]